MSNLQKPKRQKPIKVVYKKLGRQRANGLAHVKDRVIVIDETLRGKKLGEILLHETIHVAHPEMSEEEVIRTSVMQINVLWQQGWRPVDNDNSIHLQDGTK